MRTLNSRTMRLLRQCSENVMSYFDYRIHKVCVHGPPIIRTLWTQILRQNMKLCTARGAFPASVNMTAGPDAIPKASVAALHT